jgi:hypothetical protein
MAALRFAPPITEPIPQQYRVSVNNLSRWLKWWFAADQCFNNYSHFSKNGRKTLDFNRNYV